ncbi:MAG: hypothetical protein ACOYJ1_13890 [Peptococcales bacterium]|jgi:hypothetical protein
MKRICLLILIFFILLAVGCSVSLQEEKEHVINEENDLKQDLEQVDQAVVTEILEQIPGKFIEMLENHPLHRHGELSPDKRHYAYEEKSSIILVRLPTAEECKANEAVVPKVLFTDGIRKKISFAEIEADYAHRLKQPLLTQEELNEARNQLRSVYNWDFFFYQKFSPDGRYLSYLGETNFGSERTCTVYVVDMEDNCKLYAMPIEENGEYAEINWQADNETLEIYLPSALGAGGEYLALRRQWHIPSGQSKLTYYEEDGVGNSKELAPEDAQKIIAKFMQAEAELSRKEKKWDELTVDQMVAALSDEELAAEYAKYFTLYDVQKEELRKRGYSDETIAKMDIFDFEREEKEWLLSEQKIQNLKNIYHELKDEDLSNWTNGKYEEYIYIQIEKNNAPPVDVKQEMLERGLPQDLDSLIAKEFHGWENMLAYTNEAIMAMYDAKRQTLALFKKGEEYRLAVRAAYIKKMKS